MPDQTPPPSLNVEQLFRELDTIKDLIATADARVEASANGVHERLDKLNGRTRAMERNVATMWVLWGIVGAIGMALIPLIGGAL